jgi:glycerol-3-phosphate O-acyltransferase
MLKTAHLFYAVVKKENVRFSSALNEEQHLDKVLKETMDHLQAERLIHRVNVAGEETDGDDEEALYATHDRNRRRLDYYKNSILHYFLPYAFVSASFLATGRPVVPKKKILEDAAFLRHLFSQEFVFPKFVFPPEADSAGSICNALDNLVQLRLLYRIDGGYAARSGRRPDLLSFARLIQSYFESYFVVGSSLRHIAHRRVSQRRFLWRVRFNGYRLYQTGRIRLPESLSQFNFQSAVHYLVDQKVILRQFDRSFREGGAYFILTPERRRLQWGRIKRFLRLYR